MDKHKTAWYLWAIGSVLIVLCWVSVVPVKVGWLGFCIAMVGSAMSWGARPPRA